MTRLTKTERANIRLTKHDLHLLEKAYKRSCTDDTITFNAWLRTTLLQGMACTGHKDSTTLAW